MTEHRIFTWRKPLLNALRLDPHISHACKAAGISRNSVYAHMRRNRLFRNQVSRAIGKGREAGYEAHLKLLRADPAFQRAMQRAHAAIQRRALLNSGITNYTN